VRSGHTSDTPYPSVKTAKQKEAVGLWACVEELVGEEREAQVDLWGVLQKKALSPDAT